MPDSPLHSEEVSRSDPENPHAETRLRLRQFHPAAPAARARSIGPRLQYVSVPPEAISPGHLPTSSGAPRRTLAAPVVATEPPGSSQRVPPRAGFSTARRPDPGGAYPGGRRARYERSGLA